MPTDATPSGDAQCVRVERHPLADSEVSVDVREEWWDGEGEEGWWEEEGEEGWWKEEGEEGGAWLTTEAIVGIAAGGGAALLCVLVSATGLDPSSGLQLALPPVLAAFACLLFTQRCPPD